MRITSLATLAFTGAVLVLTAPPARAASNPEARCQKGRYAAAAKYDACHLKAAAKYYTGGGTRLRDEGKCLTKYTATWAKLQAQASGTGTTCDAPRFEDNGDGTVNDRLTGLQWEQKQNVDAVANPADPHDADNQYAWSATGTAADGAAFTEFLAALNNGACFAGQCDWRLPSLGELQTLLLAPYPLGGIDPMLGPINFNSSYYWSSTSTQLEPEIAWFLHFQDGSTSTASKTIATLAVRAVRGGL